MMLKLTCAHCGRRVPFKLGVMPRRCACGAEFEWAPFGGAGKAAAVLTVFALFISPLLFLIWSARSLIQASIILCAVEVG